MSSDRTVLGQFRCPLVSPSEQHNIDGCPFGHDSSQPEKLLQLPSDICVMHLLGKCRDYTHVCTWMINSKSGHFIKCSNGFHPTMAEMADIDSYRQSVATFEESNMQAKQKVQSKMKKLKTEMKSLGTKMEKLGENIMNTVQNSIKQDASGQTITRIQLYSNGNKNDNQQISIISNGSSISGNLTTGFTILTDGHVPERSSRFSSSTRTNHVIVTRQATRNQREQNTDADCCCRCFCCCLVMAWICFVSYLCFQ